MTTKHVASNFIQATIPMWDNFEAVFFVIAGFSVGIVFGVLFPSVWRSFRRGFRRTAHYAPKRSERWEETLKTKITILNKEDSPLPEEQSMRLTLVQAFLVARYAYQRGDFRRAVGIYITILTNEQVSKQETNQALFELSQVYEALGLHGRAFETLFELLNRHPDQDQVLYFLLKLCMEQYLSQKVLLVLNVYKGIPGSALRRTISHAVCHVASEVLAQGDRSRAIDYARLAVKWDRTSARALSLLWQTTSAEFWEHNALDTKMKWLSFATDLEAQTQILTSQSVSPLAGAAYLGQVLWALAEVTPITESYGGVEKEFQLAFDWSKQAPPHQKKLLQSLCYALILCWQEKHPVAEENAGRLLRMADILAVITGLASAPFSELLARLVHNGPHLLLGLLAHQCNQCQGVSLSFAWQCRVCSAKESLFPVESYLVVPTPEAP